MFAAFLFHAAKFFFKVVEFEEDLCAVGMFTGEDEGDVRPLVSAILTGFQELFIDLVQVIAFIKPQEPAVEFMKAMQLFPIIGSTLEYEYFIITDMLQIELANARYSEAHPGIKSIAITWLLLLQHYMDGIGQYR